MPALSDQSASTSDHTTSSGVATAKVSQTGSVCSLLALVELSVDEIAIEAAKREITLSWSVDPRVPTYVALHRADPSLVIVTMLRLAMNHCSDRAIHFSIESTLAGHIELHLEGVSDIDVNTCADWLLLQWLAHLQCELSIADSGYWRCRLPFQFANAPESKSIGQTALVLSADTDTRLQTLRAVRHFGISVLEAADPDQALTMAKQQEFALIMIDADLRGSLGLQFARNLRIAAPNQPLLALLSSSVPDSSDDFAWIKLWMHKPPRLQELELAFAAAKMRADRRAKNA